MSLASNLRLDLADPLIPWSINPSTFKNMTASSEDSSYKIGQLFPTDED